MNEKSNKNTIFVYFAYFAYFYNLEFIHGNLITHPIRLHIGHIL
jgi:hypothetical protein